MTSHLLPARHPARKRGVTLIEAVLFISIALGLIVGGIVFFQQASTAQRTNDAVRTISGISSEIRALYQSQPTFAGIAATTLINAGAVPSNIVNAAGTGLTNEWGGAINIGPAQTAAGFYVTYVGIPVEACVRLATFDTSGSGVVGSGIAGVHIDPTDATAAVASYVVTAGDGAAPTVTTAAGLTPAAAAGTGGAGGTCAPAGATTTDVTWVFTR